MRQQLQVSSVNMYLCLLWQKFYSEVATLCVLVEKWPVGKMNPVESLPELRHPQD